MMEEFGALRCIIYNLGNLYIFSLCLFQYGELHSLYLSLVDGILTRLRQRRS